MLDSFLLCIYKFPEQWLNALATPRGVMNEIFKIIMNSWIFNMFEEFIAFIMVLDV